MNNEKKLYFYLNQDPEVIKEKVQEQLLFHFEGDKRKTKIFLTYNFYKFLYILSKIYTTNTHFKRDPFDYCPLSAKKLEAALGGKNNNTYSTIIKIGEDAGLWKRNNYYSKKRGISKTFKIIDGEHTFKRYLMDGEHRFLVKVKKIKMDGEHWYIDSEITKRTAKFLMSIDYSGVDRLKLDNNQLLQLDMFADDKYQVYSKDTNRICNSFTNISTEIRKQLMYDGELLGSVDLVNSQLIFFVEVIKEYAENNNIELDNQSWGLINLIRDGRFYESIFQKDVIEGEDRKAAKEKVFSYLYGHNKYSEAKEVGKIFKEQYPQIFDIVWLLKVNNYNHLSILLQAKESHIIQTAYKNTNVDAITLHDALYAKESDLEVIKEVLKSTCINMGVECTIKASDGEIIKTYGEVDFNPIQAITEPNKVNNNNSEGLEVLPENIDQDHITESNKIQPQENKVDNNYDEDDLANFDMDDLKKSVMNRLSA
ncbi:hypothetical protein [Echinicola shivajiensis]|uniref:hypothetical protein n=1 Tax=Echinicola shivajiensis TaxID=1035916 RepID=UPI001BFC70EA|nr:hypothetical protein [Echinicola shivajiensis]